ncbi:MAG: isochorismatase family cysteine hydrolase [Acidimicrobiia bacterium]
MVVGHRRATRAGQEGVEHAPRALGWRRGGGERWDRRRHRSDPTTSPQRRAAAVASWAQAAQGEHDEASQIHPALAPRPDEPVVLKKRASAFSGSDLEILLRSMAITHLVLAGVATSGVVLSTLRDATDRDYERTVLSDACADTDDEVHRVLVEKLFRREAAVLSVADWASRAAAGTDR